MSAAGDAQITKYEATRTEHTAAGPKTSRVEMIRMTLRTPNGPLQVDVDAGDWSRGLANGQRVPVELSVPGVVTRAG